MSTVERAIIVSAPAANGEVGHMFLQQKGDLLDFLVEEEGYTPEEVGIVPPAEGFWYWGGTVSISSQEEEYLIYATGEWRVLTLAEWEQVQDNEDVL